MANTKDKIDEKNYETITSTQGRPQNNYTSKERININDINKRNAEQEKHKRRNHHIS